MDKAIKGEIEMDNKRQMTNNRHEKKCAFLDKVKEWGFDIRLDVNLDELIFYCNWCDGHQFRRDLFTDGEFVDEYMAGKFSDFQNRFPSFLASLDDKYKTRFCVAVHNFYMNNHKEQADGKR